MRNQYVKLQGKTIDDDLSDEVFDEANDFDEWVVKVDNSEALSLRSTAPNNQMKQ